MEVLIMWVVVLFVLIINKTTLHGSPKEVGNLFWCYRNELTTLDGSPSIIYSDFHCSSNKLTTLEGSPERVGGSFRCSGNKLTSLKGSPFIINDTFDIDSNPLTIIDSSIIVNGSILIDYMVFDDKIITLSQDRLRCLFEHGVDYDIFDKNGTFHYNRLERMFKDFNI